MVTAFTSLNRVATLQRWIRLSCTRRGIRAMFKDDIPTAYCTRDTVVIPRLSDRMTEDDEKVIRHQVCHEVDGHHNAGPEIFDIMEENNIDMRKPLGALFNIIEDQRIERAASGTYDGNRAIISDGREVMGRRSLDKILEGKARTSKGLTDETAKMQSAYITALLAQATWCVGASLHLHQEIEETVDWEPSIQGYMKKLMDAGVVTSILTLESEHESFALAKKVYALLWDKTEEEVEQEIEAAKAEAKKGEGKGKGKEGKGTPEVGEGEYEPGEGDPVGRVDPRTGKYQLPFDYFVKSNHSGEPESAIGHGLGLDYTNHTMSDVFRPIPFDQFNIIKFKDTPPYRSGRLSMFGGPLAMMEASSAFANKMRRYLQVRAATYYTGGKKKGLINSRALYRAGLPIVGDGEWNRKVFRTKHTSDLLDAAVSILCDVSGSMSGPKVVHATRAAMLTNHVISNVLRVNTEILTFTWMGTQPWIAHIKEFGERVSDEDVYQRFDHAANTMMGNDDADSILYAYDRLLRQRNKRKVLIVMSDGSPADCEYGSDPAYALKTTVQQVHTQGLASIVGIGIMDPSVKVFYPTHTIIDQAEELEDKLLDVLNTQILNYDRS